MFADVGGPGRWHFSLSSSSVEFGISGFEHGQSSIHVVRAPMSAPYSAFRTWVSSRQRQDKEPDKNPYIRTRGKGKRGYRRVDDIDVLD